MIKKIHNIVATSDSGNYSIKTIVGDSIGKFTNVYIKSDLSEVEEALLLERCYPRAGKDILNSLYVSIKLESSVKSVEFMFNDRAKFFNNAKFRPNIEKRSDLQLAMNTILAVVVTYLNSIDTSEYEEEMDIKIKLNSGLSVNEWRRQGSEERYTNMLKGNHTIEFLDDFFTSELGIKRVNVEVEDVHIHVEGISALKLIANTDYVNPSEYRDYKNKIIIIIDIGQHTTDIVGVRYYHNERINQLLIEAIPRFGFGMDIGIGDIQSDIINDIYNSTLVDGRSTVTIDDIVDARNNNYKLPGYGVNIEEIYTKHMDNFSKDLAEKFIKACNEGVRQKVALVILSGGGSKEIIIEKQFKKYIKELNFDEEIVDGMYEYCDPVLANALGYHVMSKFK